MGLSPGIFHRAYRGCGCGRSGAHRKEVPMDSTIVTAFTGHGLKATEKILKLIH